FQVVVGDRSTASALIDSPVSHVTLSRSVGPGVQRAQQAAKHLKKAILELGGSDPFIVADDADLDAAAKGAVAGRFVNTGQSCIAAKRFLVVDSVAKEFTARFVEQVRALRVGDPLRPTTDIGPLVNEAQREEIEGQVKDAARKRARVEVGGKRVPGPGWFYEPTVLSRVTRAMRVLQEETFGPVAPILAVRDLDAAVREANDFEFGLGASLWTRDLERAEGFVRQIDSGMEFVNGVVKSDPRMPFGGVKHSAIAGTRKYLLSSEAGRPQRGHVQLEDDHGLDECVGFEDPRMDLAETSDVPPVEDNGGGSARDEIRVINRGHLPRLPEVAQEAQDQGLRLRERSFVVHRRRSDPSHVLRAEDDVGGLEDPLWQLSMFVQTKDVQEGRKQRGPKRRELFP